MEEIKELATLDAPYGKKISLVEVKYDNGFSVMRMRIKEGKRFTDMDLDANTAKSLRDIFSQWLETQTD